MPKLADPEGTRRLRVSLLTLHRVKNYGSVLQTFASQHMLRSLGHDVIVTDYWRPDLTDSIDDIATRMGWSSPLRRRIYKMVWSKWATRNRIVFNDFLEANIVLTGRSYVGYEELVADPPDADLYVVGSDQVWNDDYNVGGSEPYFLAHVPQGAPRFAFSSSFGKAELSTREQDLVQRELRKFRAISVRETSAVEILAGFGIEAEPVADPILAVDPRAWDEIAPPEATTENYVLAYCLNPGREFDRVLQEVAASLGIRSKRIALKTRRPSTNRYVVQPTVYEFVNLFRNARHVVTDSFHGTVFSLVFNRPFTIVLPPKYGERILSILRYLRLEDRVVSSGVLPLLAEVDWTDVNKGIDEYRLATRTFLARVTELGAGPSAQDRGAE